MKKVLLVISMILVLFLIGCKTNENLPNDTIVNDTNQNKIEDELKNDEAMKIIQNYFDLQAKKASSYETFLESLELVDKVTFDEKVTMQDPNGISELRKTNIKYEEFKEKLLSYMSLNRFETFTNGFEEKDGYLYTLPLGATGYSFEPYEIELKEKNDNHYVYIVKAISREVELIEEYTTEATLVKENGKIVLDSYEHIQVENISFDVRTESFFTKKEEIKGDRLRQEFSNIRLAKVGNYYELKADLVGDVKIDTDVLENAIKEIETKKLEKIEIKTTSGEAIVIYGRKPQEIIDWHESVKNDPFYEEQGLKFEELGVPTYEDSDWLSAKSDDEWLNSEGIPMYVKPDFEEWGVLKKEDDGYYLEGRNYSGGMERKDFTKS